MPTFKYEAMDTSGGEVKDSVEAGSEDEAQQKIRQMGYFVTKITEQAGAKKGKARRGQRAAARRARSSPSAAFPPRNSAPSRASSPPSRTPACRYCGACAILEGQMKPGVLKNALIDVVDDVESGSTLSESFGKHPKCFDRLYVNMVKAGEAGGALETILKRLAEFKEKSQSLKRRITGAMIYPVRRPPGRGVILSFIMIFIIPKFEKIFKDFGMTLPDLTKFLMAVSRWFGKYWVSSRSSPIRTRRRCASTSTRAGTGRSREIEASQEVVRWFFRVGGAAGTVAKSMSAYDMAVSDAVYGKADRYVWVGRLQGMLDHEFDLNVERLDEERGDSNCFFAFANTVVARSYRGGD